jgi:hypothetical protein
MNNPDPPPAAAVRDEDNLKVARDVMDRATMRQRLGKRIAGETPSALIPAEPISQPVSQDMEADLKAVRATADGWLKTVTAAFSLFSIAGLAFNKDVIKDAITDASFVVPAVLAVCLALTAIGLGTFAAQGWPKVPKAGPEGTVRVRSRANAIKKAINGLVLSMIAAGLTVVCLLIAVYVAYAS